VKDNINILIGCYSFKSFTGSEVSFYELAIGLRELGHTVSIYSLNIGDPLVKKVEGITIENELSLNKKFFDVVIFSHGPVLWGTLKNIKANKFINVIRSEVLPLEEPVIDKKVTAYVSIRPSIQSYLYTKYNIDSKLIYNPFDTSRYNKRLGKDRSRENRVVLFPGSLDYLRIQPIQFLLKMSDQQKYIVRHVGRCDYNIQHHNFETHSPTDKMEEFYAECDIVSGIFLGRTSIEGILCGKKVYQFDVDEKGNILKHYWHTERDLGKFDKLVVAKQYTEI
jgi:hypothetical protein